MKKAMSWLDINFEPILMVFLFYSMTLLLALQVILRFGFQTGFSWGEEVARFMFVWLMYFSISYATRNQRHIKVTLLIKNFKENTQKILMIISDLMFLTFAVIALASVWEIVQSIRLYGDQAITINVSLNVIYGAGLLGFALMIIRISQGLVWKLKNFSKSLDYFENYGGVFTGAEQICFLRDHSGQKEKPPEETKRDASEAEDTRKED